MSDEYKDNPLHPNINGRVFFNPGSGTVEGATLENATANMVQYIKDSPLADEIEFERGWENADECGRFRFNVFWKRCETFSVEVDMPGWPLEQVRYTGDENQNIWNFPRLYVDGSSWVWEFAILK